MTREYIIQGDLVEEVERNVVRSMPLADMLRAVAPPSAPTGMFVPRTAIYMHLGTDTSRGRGQRLRVLCEVPPGIKNLIKFRRRYRLSMPWTYFIFTFTGRGDMDNGTQWMMETKRVFHAPRQINALTDYLWCAFLPNVDNFANICFGSTGSDVQQPLHQRIDQTVNDWYLTEFNHDMLSGRPHPFPFWAEHQDINATFRHWVDFTREHGASAYTRFNEWSGTTPAPRWTLSELLTTDSIRPTMAVVDDAIPPIEVPATFGRINEWLTGPTLTPVIRGRILTELTALRDENNGLVETRAVAVPNDQPDRATVAEEDDGGEPI